MRRTNLAGPSILVILFAASIHAQAVVVYDPNAQPGVTALPKAEEAILDRDALPAVRKMIGKDVCEEELGPAGVAHGSFTAPGLKQTLVFYQYCQTGNGFGWNGLVLIENGRMSGNFVSDGGWANDIASVADVNQNGLTEFALAYSGGMHQGQGGTGVELLEFSHGLPRGIGWYKASEFGPTDASSSWKLTATPGKPPVFYKQKYFSAAEGKKPRTVGRNAVTKLDKAFVSKFEVVK